MLTLVQNLLSLKSISFHKICHLKVESMKLKNQSSEWNFVEKWWRNQLKRSFRSFVRLNRKTCYLGIASRLTQTDFKKKKSTLLCMLIYFIPLPAFIGRSGKKGGPRPVLLGQKSRFVNKKILNRHSSRQGCPFQVNRPLSNLEQSILKVHQALIL